MVLEGERIKIEVNNIHSKRNCTTQNAEQGDKTQEIRTRTQETRETQTTPIYHTQERNPYRQKLTRRTTRVPRKCNK